jgi:hypothetical protein
MQYDLNHTYQRKMIKTETQIDCDIMQPQLSSRCWRGF